MGTKRSSGTVHTPKGVNQGNSLIDPNTGQPVDVIEDNQGIKRLAVDANITAQVGDVEVELDYQDDSVSIGDPTTDNILKINPDGSINTNVQIDAADGDNIAIRDSDGHELNINPDGSINVTTGGTLVTTPVIANIPVLVANTEQSYVFPTNTKRYVIKAKGTSKVQIAFVSGQSGTNYMTIHPGNVYEETGLSLSSFTIYFQLSKIDDVEILSWS